MCNALPRINERYVCLYERYVCLSVMRIQTRVTENALHIVTSLSVTRIRPLASSDGEKLRFWKLSLTNFSSKCFKHDRFFFSFTHITVSLLVLFITSLDNMFHSFAIYCY